MQSCAAHYRDKTIQDVRTTGVLTDAYVDCDKVIDNSDEHFNTLTLNINYTKGSSDSLQWVLLFSDDGVTYGQQKLENISSPTTTLVDHNYSAAVAGLQTHSVRIRHKYIKVKAKITGTATSSDAIITSKLSNE